jgi:hypothetical protein
VATDEERRSKAAAYAREWRRKRGAKEVRRAGPLDPARVTSLYDSGLSCSEIGRELDCSAEHVRRTLRRIGHERRGCGAAGRRREDNPFYETGRSIDKSGYVLVLHPDRPGYIREHRLVMQQHIGRELLPGEVVHHRNGVRDDNRIENLLLYASNADHLRDELTGRVPNWTPEGKARMLEACRRPRGKRRAATPTG